MKLPKFIVVILLITVISLCFVYQQTQITMLSYINSKNDQGYQVLLDKNIALRYNLAKTNSISYLGDKILAQNTDFEIPTKMQLAQIETPVEEAISLHNLVPKETILSKIFGTRAEAEAKSIK